MQQAGSALPKESRPHIPHHARNEQEANTVITSFGFDAALSKLVAMIAGCDAGNKQKNSEAGTDKKIWRVDKTNGTLSLEEIGATIEVPTSTDGSVMHLLQLIAGNDVLPYQSEEQHKTRQVLQTWLRRAFSCPTTMRKFVDETKRIAASGATGEGDVAAAIHKMEEAAAVGERDKYTPAALHAIQDTGHAVLSHFSPAQNEEMIKFRNECLQQSMQRLVTEGEIEDYCASYIDKLQQGPLRELFAGDDEYSITVAGKHHFQIFTNILETARTKYEGSRYHLQVQGLQDLTGCLSGEQETAYQQIAPWVSAYNRTLVQLVKQFDPSGEQVKMCCGSA